MCGIAQFCVLVSKGYSGLANFLSWFLSDGTQILLLSNSTVNKSARLLWLVLIHWNSLFFMVSLLEGL